MHVLGCSSSHEQGAVSVLACLDDLWLLWPALEVLDLPVPVLPVFTRVFENKQTQISIHSMKNERENNLLAVAFLLREKAYICILKPNLVCKTNSQRNVTGCLGTQHLTHT